MFNHVQLSKPGFYKLGLPLLRIILALLSSIYIVQSQPVDSPVHLNAVVSGEYIDLFRQHTDRSTTIIFARLLDARVSASRGRDTLTLFYNGWNQYASYNSTASSAALAADVGLRSASLQWVSFKDWFAYSGTLLFPFTYRFLPAYYRTWALLRPWDEKIKSTFSYERVPASITSGLGLKDYSFLLDEKSTSSAWNVTLQIQPVELIETSVSWGKRISTTKGTIVGYTMLLDWHVQNYFAHIKIKPNPSLSGWIGWERSEENGESHLLQYNLVFGDLAYGELISDRWYIGGKTSLFSLPVSCEYNFRRWKGTDVGHLESWPFTSLAATVFDNRIYYAIDGLIELHQIESEMIFKGNVISFKPSIGILSVYTNIWLDHWEPDFLVFGIKNAGHEPFSIQRCWLLKLGCQIDFPIFGANAAVFAEQFIPVSIKYRQEQRGAAQPGTTTVSPGTPTSTDGGRRLRIQISLP